MLEANIRWFCLAGCKILFGSKNLPEDEICVPEEQGRVELMRSLFDKDNLPIEFGGKAILKYDHEEFSKQMARDDLKALNLWGFDQKARSLQVLQHRLPVESVHTLSILPMLAVARSQEKPCRIEATVTRMRWSFSSFCMHITNFLVSCKGLRAALPTLLGERVP